MEALWCSFKQKYQPKSPPSLKSTTDKTSGEKTKQKIPQNKLHGPPFRDEMLKMSFNQSVCEDLQKIKRITF